MVQPLTPCAAFHEKAIICQATWRSFSSSCLWESGKRPRFYTFPQAVSPFFGLQVGPFKEVFAARLPFAL
jgi:hypothetical protein